MIPLLQVAFLSLFLAQENTSISKFAVAIGTVRALRQVKKASPKYLKLFGVNTCTCTCITLERKEVDRAGCKLANMRKNFGEFASLNKFKFS